MRIFIWFFVFLQIAQVLAFPVRDFQALTSSSRQGHHLYSSYSSRGLSCYSEGRGKDKGSHSRDDSRVGRYCDEDFFSSRSLSSSPSSSSVPPPLHTKISRSPASSSSVNGASSSFFSSTSSSSPSSYSASPSKKKKSSRETKKTATLGCESSLDHGMSAKTRESLGILAYGQSEREDEEDDDDDEASCEKKLLPVATSLLSPHESLCDAAEEDRRNGRDHSEPGEEDHRDEEHMLRRKYRKEGEGKRSGAGKESGALYKKTKTRDGQGRPSGDYGEDQDHHDEERRNGYDEEEEVDGENEGFSFLKGSGGHLDLTRGSLQLKKPLKTIVNGVTNFLKCDEVLWDATDVVLGGITAGNGQRKEYHLEERVISSSSSPLPPQILDDSPPSSLSPPPASTSLSIDRKIGFCF